MPTSTTEPARPRDAVEAALADGRRRRELHTLGETARLFAEEPDLQALAKLAADRACTLVGASGALVVWIEASEPAVTACCPSTVDWHLDLADSTTLAGWVVRFRRPCFDPEGRLTPAISGTPGRVFAGVPILNHQHEVVGVVEIHEPRGGTFTEDHRITLEAFTWQALIAFDRARTLERMHEWTKSLETLLAFTSVISQHASADVIIRRLVENAASLLGADGGLAGLVLPLRDQDEVAMVSEAYWRHGEWRNRARRWARMEGLPGYLLETEFPYITNDYAADHLADPVFLLGDTPVARALCTPIRGSDHALIGFFELHRNAAQPEFTWQDVAFLESLASMAAITIENARLVKIVEDKNEQIRALSARHMERLEEERAHIARELHDEAGQALIGIKLRLQAIARGLPRDLAPAREQLDDMREEVNASTRRLKNLARRLRPPALDHFGLDVALRQLADEFQQHTGISVLLDCQSELPRLASDLAVYRVAQEAMTNAAKHASPTTVRLKLRFDDDQIVFSVADDGAGFDPALATSGLGLLGLRERVAQVGGEIALESEPGQGTMLTARIPR